MEEIMEKKPLELNNYLQDKCLDYMEARKLSPKTKLLYSKVLENLFKERILTQNLYNTYYRKGNYFKAVLKLIEDAASDSDIIFTPYHKIKQKVFPPKIPQYWSDKDIQRIIKYMESLNSGYALLMKIAYYCSAGLRFSSALFLRWRDFKWEEWNKDRSRIGRVTIRISKGSKQAILPVDVILMKELYELAEREKKIAFDIPYNLEVFEDDDYIFINKNSPYTDLEIIKKEWDKMDYLLEKISKNYLQEKFKFHSIRHSKAKLLRDRGADLLTISSLLMHSNLETTRIYVQMSDRDSFEKYESLGSFGS